MPAADLAALRAEYANCAVDVGTGDARFAYHLASERPDWLVIGLDALDEPMGEIAYKAARKPARGGRPNLVLLRAAIEALPAELAQIADEVDVLLPWGALARRDRARATPMSSPVSRRWRGPGARVQRHAQRRDLARFHAGALRGSSGADPGVRGRGDRTGVPPGRHRSRARRAT